VPTFVLMDWKTRFPVGLVLLAALMLAGGVSAATSMRLAEAQKASVVAHRGSGDREEGNDPGESRRPEESGLRKEVAPSAGDHPGRHGHSAPRHVVKQKAHPQRGVHFRIDKAHAMQHAVDGKSNDKAHGKKHKRHDKHHGHHGDDEHGQQGENDGQHGHDGHGGRD
jgi:hypothetical protein